MSVADYKAPFGAAVVSLSGELAERYEAAGWTKVEQPKPRKRAKADDESNEK